MIKIKNLIWNEWNIEHTTRHGVTQEEIEEVCAAEHFSSRPMDEREKRNFKKWIKK